MSLQIKELQEKIQDLEYQIEDLEGQDAMVGKFYHLSWNDCKEFEGCTISGEYIAVHSVDENHWLWGDSFCVNKNKTKIELGGGIHCLGCPSDGKPSAEITKAEYEQARKALIDYLSNGLRTSTTSKAAG